MTRKIISHFIKLVFLLWVFSILPVNPSYAETQQETRCYSECAAYKFAWMGDICFDMVQTQCTIGSSNIVSKTISFIKDAYSLIVKGELAMIVGVTDVFKAWFICRPLIEDCIVPQLNTCKSTCEYNPYFYSPNISVGSQYSNYLHGVVYDDTRKKLYFKVVNNGLGYAWDIGVEAKWGSTEARNVEVNTNSTFFNETIPELLFLGSRQGSPPTVGGVVVDFLIDESNFSNFLSRFKSDANQTYIPPAWEKTINFDAPEGKLTKIVFTADSQNKIPEYSEFDNTYILEIDKRPAPAKFEIEDVNINRVENSLTEYDLEIVVKNVGEEGGNVAVELYEGKYTGTQNSIYSRSIDYGTYDKVNTFGTRVNVDVSEGSPSCGRNKIFTILISSQYTGNSATEIQIPLYAGVISGHVENLFGKNIQNAVVSLSNGMQTETNKYGNYVFSGIDQLGSILVNISHPDYTENQSKDIVMEFNPGNTLTTVCEIPGLLHTETNFILKDEPVELTIKLKDRSGTSITGKINIACEHFSYNHDVIGEGTFPDIQPEKCQFNASASGFISQSQTILLTAPGQTVEFILTRLLGRDSDQDLSIHTPILLWEKELPDEEFLSDITATKNGKLLVFYASNSKQKYGKLYFINPQNGAEINVPAVPYTVVAQGKAHVDSSYDGRTVGLNVKTGPSSKDDNSIRLFNEAGQEYNSTTIDGRLVACMSVSPDGTYIDGVLLMNNSLHKYTKNEIYGQGHGDGHFHTPSTGVSFFTKNNNVVAKYREGFEIMNFRREKIREIGNTDGIARVIDTSQSESEIIIRTDNKLYYFSPGGNWNHNVERGTRHVSAAVSNGGDYAMATEGSGGGQWLKLKIFGRSGSDVTPPFDYKDVTFVTANDTGMYFMTVRGEKIAYYKIGSYGSEYNPNENTGHEKGEDFVSDLQTYNYTSKTFEDTYAIPWLGVSESQMYKATKRITFSTNFGTISFTQGTVFTRFEDKPIVLFGQAQIHATRPVEMVLIKNKLYEPDSFYDKLYAYYNNQLSENEYVIAKNLHTKYLAETKNDRVKISVSDGEVEVKFNKTKFLVKDDHELVIDKTGKETLKKSGGLLYFYIIILLIISIITFFEIKYKKSEKLKRINQHVIAFAKKFIYILTAILLKIIQLIKRLIRLIIKNRQNQP